MAEKNIPVSEILVNLDRSTERFDPKKIGERIEEIHQQLDIERAGDFIRAMAAVESAWLNDDLADSQVLEIHAKIKALMADRLTEKTIEYIEAIDNALARFSSLAEMMGLDKKEIPNPYTELLNGELKIPSYKQLSRCRETMHERFIVVPPWSSKMMAEHFPKDIEIINDVVDFIFDEAKPDNFYMIATRFTTSNYTSAANPGMTGIDLPIDELEEKVQGWRDELLYKDHLRSKGLSIREYLYFQLDGFQQANGGFREFKNKSIRDLGRSCVLYDEKLTDDNHITWARGIADGIWLRRYTREQATDQEFRTRLAIHFDQDNDKIMDEERM